MSSNESPNSMRRSGIGLPARSSRGEKRRQALLKAARGLFTGQGYEATSLQQIVGQAGGSLSTAYQLFGSKAGIFRAVILDMAAHVREQALPEDLLALPPAEALPRIAEQLLVFSVDPEVLAIRRQLIAESHAMPELAAELHAWFEENLHQPMQAYFRTWSSACGFAVDEPEQLTSLFMQMCCSWHMHHLLLGVGQCPEPADMAGLARAAVKLCFSTAGLPACRPADQGDSSS